MSRVLAPPPITGGWSTPVGPWSPRHGRAPRCAPPPVPAAAPPAADPDFVAWAIAALDPDVAHDLGLTWPGVPDRSVMHRKYAHRRRSRRPSRRNR